MRNGPKAEAVQAAPLSDYNYTFYIIFSFGLFFNTEFDMEGKKPKRRREKITIDSAISR